MHTHLQSFREPDGRIRLLVDPYQIRRRMWTGQKRRRKSARDHATTPLYSWAGLNELVDGLRNADVEWELKNGKRGGVAKVIAEMDWAKAIVPDPLHGGQRQLWRLTLSAPWAALLDTLGVWYDPRPIVQMKNAISQAVARHVLTHDRDGWRPDGLPVDKVLGWLGIQATGQQRRDARRRVAQDAPGFVAYGLLVGGGFIRRAGVAQMPGGVAQMPGAYRGIGL